MSKIDEKLRRIITLYLDPAVAVGEKQNAREKIEKAAKEMGATFDQVIALYRNTSADKPKKWVPIPEDELADLKKSKERLQEELIRKSAEASAWKEDAEYSIESVEIIKSDLTQAEARIEHLQKEAAEANRGVINIEVGRVQGLAGHRPVDADHVAELARSIEVMGLLHPLIVREEPEVSGNKSTCTMLVSGNNRLAAVKRLGWKTVPCIIIKADDLVAELATIDENIVRKQLDGPLLSYALRRRKEIYEEIHPQTKHNGRWKSDPNSGPDKAPAFIDATAEATGKSRSSIGAATARGEALGEELLDIAGTCLASGVEMDALGKMTPEERAPIIAEAKAGKKVSARAPRKVDNVEKLVELWDSINDDERFRFIELLDAKGWLPKASIASDEKVAA